MTSIMTSRDFNQHTNKAQKAAENAPVFITKRGKMAHVLLSYADYLQLTGQDQSILDALGDPDPASAAIDFQPERLNTPERAVTF